MIITDAHLSGPNSGDFRIPTYCFECGYPLRKTPLVRIVSDNGGKDIWLHPWCCPKLGEKLINEGLDAESLRGDI